VYLKRASEEIQLKVHDSGIGFDVARARNGLVITRMEERLKLMKGHFSIDSKPGNGATILARVPLELEDEAEQNYLDRNSPDPRDRKDRYP